MQPNGLAKVFAPVFDEAAAFADRLGVSFLFRDIQQSLKMKYLNPISDQVAFVEDFDQWHQDGANMVDALSKMKLAAKESKATKLVFWSSFAERAAEKLESTLIDGRPVSDGMKGLFSTEIIDMFAVGESTDTLSGLMEEYLVNMQEKKALMGGVLKKLLYPVGFLVLITVALAALGEVGVPKLKTLVNLNDLPKDARQLVDLSIWVSTWVSLISTVLTALYLLIKWSLPNWNGKLRLVFDRYFFIYTVYKSLVANDLMKKISLLSSSGISMGETLRMMTRNCTPYQGYYLNQIQTKLGAETGSIAEYLNVGLLENGVYQRLSALSSLEGEDAKFQAMKVAGRRSGAAAKSSIEKKLVWAVIFAWLILGFMVLFILLGLMDFTFNIDKMVQKRF